MSARRWKLLGLWAALLCFGASIYLGPYFAAYRIRQAVAAGDAEALATWVDFEALRGNLKSEVRRVVNARRRAAEATLPDAGGAPTEEAREEASAPNDESPDESPAGSSEASPQGREESDETTPEPDGGGDPGAGGPFSGEDIGSRLAVAVGEAMVDRYATPEGVDRALRSRVRPDSGWGAFLTPGDGDEDPAGESDRSPVSVSAGYNGWNEFAVQLGATERAEGETLWAEILFDRRGIWTWRVTGARVSPGAIRLLMP